jgi:hypothetical protein
MSLENDIHQLVLGLDGVAAVYTADPLWLAAVKQLGSLLGPGGEAAVPFVVCSESGGDGDGEGEGDGLGEAGGPVMTVKVRIGTDGSTPAPAMARDVAVAIRSFVAARRPGLGVKAVVEISAIGV